MTCLKSHCRASAVAGQYCRVGRKAGADEMQTVDDFVVGAKFKVGAPDAHLE